VRSTEKARGRLLTEGRHNHADACLLGFELLRNRVQNDLRVRFQRLRNAGCGFGWFVSGRDRLGHHLGFLFERLGKRAQTRHGLGWLLASWSLLYRGFR